MTMSVLICDDSGMARKQLARSLPKTWSVDITFAEHGAEALEYLKQGIGDLMFLDLTMPVMDGYQTLQAIRERDLSVMVIVVSGDVQAEASQRVKALGAMDFIKKPADPKLVLEVLQKYGLLHLGELEESPDGEPGQSSTEQHSKDGGDHSPQETAAKVSVTAFDCYQEITNVAIGRAGDLLARLTGEFVQLPVPQVNFLEGNELKMALESVNDQQVNAVCQGFIGPQIAGEALLMFGESSFEDMAKLMKNEHLNEEGHMEVLSDLSGALLGAILNGLGEQLNISFSESYPTVLGRHTTIEELKNAKAEKWHKTLAIEVEYHIENYDVVCSVLLLFTHDSVAALDSRLEFMVA